MIYLTKTHYAALRESVTATSYQAQQMLEGLSESMAQMNLPDPDLAAIKQITGLTLREAEVMTFNNLFQVIAFIFAASLVVAPFLKKVDAETAAAIHE